MARASDGIGRDVNLPALPVPSTEPAMMLAFMRAVKEWLEVRAGSRATPQDRWVTWRELSYMGIDPQSFVLGSDPSRPPANSIAIDLPGGGRGYLPISAFERAIRGSQLYRDLNKRLDDPTRFDALPAKVRDLLLVDIAAEARMRGADIQRLETKIQSADESLAVLREEVTAAVGTAVAGVRQTIWAAAEPGQAAAGIATQVRARLDDVDGNGVTLEEVMYGNATYAGVMGQWSMKIDANGVLAGVALMASNTAAGPDSAFMIRADRFAIISPSYSGGMTLTPPSSAIPFGVDASGVYINGSVRINSSTTTLDDLAGLTGVTITGTSEFWKVDSAGAAVNTSIVLTANLTGGLSGTVTWSASTGWTGTPPTGTNTWTINAADQTADAVTYTAEFVDGSTTYTDSWTLVRLRDGSDAVSIVLTNERQGIPSDADGDNPVFTAASGEIRVYRGATRLTTGVTYALASGGNPSGLTYTLNSSTGAYAITGAGSWGAASLATTIGFEATITATGTVLPATVRLDKNRQGQVGPAGAGIVAQPQGLVFRVAADGSVTPPSILINTQLTGVAGPVTWTTSTSGHSLNGQTGSSKTIYPRTTDPDPTMGALDKLTVTVSAGAYTDTFTLLKLYDGSDALNLKLSNQAHSVPANADGSSPDFTGASCTMTVYKGSADDSSNGWAWSQTASAGVTFSGANTRTVTITGLTVDAGYVDMTATKGSTTLTERFTVTRVRRGTSGLPGDPGVRGSVTLYRTNAAYTSTYNNGAGAGLPSYKAQASTEVASATGSALKIEGDTVTFYNGTSFAIVLTYKASTNDWVEPGVVLRGDMLVDGSLTTTKLIAGVLTGFTFQTSPSGARVTINDPGNPNQIVGYDSANVERFRLNATSGVMVSAGSSNMTTMTSSSGYAFSGTTNGAVYAVQGINNSGSASGGGILGRTWTSIAGVMGESNGSSGAGVHGVGNFGGTTGVRGQALASGHGVHGTSSGAGAGVRGNSVGTGHGVHGTTASTGHGVLGESTSSGSAVYGAATGSGHGVQGVSSGAGHAVRGQGLAGGAGGYFSGGSNGPDLWLEPVFIFPSTGQVGWIKCDSIGQIWAWSGGQWKRLAFA